MTNISLNTERSRLYRGVKSIRKYKAIILLASILVFLEFLLPAMTRWNGLIIPVLTENCRAVPGFMQEIIQVEQVPSEQGWRRTITCGISGILFIIAPGILRFANWVYRLVR